MSIKRCVLSFVVSGAVVGLGTSIVSAQAVSRMRLVNAETKIMSRPSLGSDLVATVPAGTVLEELDADPECDWHWVLLPRDANGTRRTGWLQIPVVTVEAAAPAKPAAPPTKQKSEKKAQAPKEAQAPKQDDRGVERAKRDLDHAREQYEKAVNHSGAASAPVAASTQAADAPK